MQINEMLAALVSMYEQAKGEGYTGTAEQYIEHVYKASEKAGGWVQRYDLGPVTAYGEAVAQGFEGSIQEWYQYIKNAAENGQSILDAASQATAAAATARHYAEQTRDDQEGHFIRYDEPTTLLDEEKAQFHANAGVMSSADILSREAWDLKILSQEAHTLLEMGSMERGTITENGWNTSSSSTESYRTAGYIDVSGKKRLRILCMPGARVYVREYVDASQEIGHETTDNITNGSLSYNNTEGEGYGYKDVNLHSGTTVIRAYVYKGSGNTEDWTGREFALLTGDSVVDWAVGADEDVSSLKSAIPQAAEGYITIFPAWEKGSINASGVDVVDNGRYRTAGMLDAVVGESLFFAGRNFNVPIVRWYDSNGVFKTSTTGITPDESGNSSAVISAPQPKYRVVINTDNTTTHPTSTENLRIVSESELLKRISINEEDIDTLLPLLTSAVKSTNVDQINSNNYTNYYSPDSQPANSIALYSATLTQVMMPNLPIYGYTMLVQRITQKPGMAKQYGDREIAFVDNGDVYYRALEWSSDIPEGVWGEWVQFVTGLSKDKIISTNTVSFDILGDSFSGKTKSWHYYVAKYLGWTNNNYSVSGSRVALDSTISGNTRLSFLHRCANIDSSADAVVIFGGINDATDINNGNLLLGDMTSPVNAITDTATTFYGALRGVIEYIHSAGMMPDKPIIGIIPPDFEPTPVSRVTILRQIQEAEREIYSFYQIPYIDLAKECQEMYESEYNNLTYRNVGDGAETPAEGYHPSTLGYKAIANTVWGKMFEVLNARSKIADIQ